MGGDLKKIQTVGRYMVEVWKAVGMDLSKVSGRGVGCPLGRHSCAACLCGRGLARLHGWAVRAERPAGVVRG